MENVRKHRDIKVVTTKKTKLFGIRTKLSSYKVFHRTFLGYRNKKNKYLQINLSLCDFQY